MSCNVLRVESINEFSLSMRVRDIIDCSEKPRSSIEDSFLYDEYWKIEGGYSDDDWASIAGAQWRCDGSGNNWHYYVKKLLPLTRGRAELVVYWEDGLVEGLLVQDGIVEECDVVHTLIPKRKEKL